MPLPALTPIERKRFDYSDLEAAMTYVDQVLRETRRSLDAVVRGQQPSVAVQTPPICADLGMSG